MVMGRCHPPTTPGAPSPVRCRALFGDERQDYQAAVDRHYASGPPSDWRDRFVSAYATMHPWEDWAETFAHYLHIRDVLQTAIAYGVTVSGPAVRAADDAPLYSYPAAEPGEFRAMLNAWFPLTYALNAINRSLGEDDLYPFLLGRRWSRSSRSSTTWSARDEGQERV
jgi:hypothetical protein